MTGELYQLCIFIFETNGIVVADTLDDMASRKHVRDSHPMLKRGRIVI